MTEEELALKWLDGGELGVEIGLHRHKTLFYDNQEKKWQLEFSNGWKGRFPWNVIREEVINAICAIDPPMTTEFLRIKSELDLTTKPINAAL